MGPGHRLGALQLLAGAAAAGLLVALVSGQLGQLRAHSTVVLAREGETVSRAALASAARSGFGAGFSRSLPA